MSDHMVDAVRYATKSMSEKLAKELFKDSVEREKKEPKLKSEFVREYLAPTEDWPDPEEFADKLFQEMQFDKDFMRELRSIR